MAQTANGGFDHAVLWPHGDYTHPVDLNAALGNPTDSVAYGINDAGYVVGAEITAAPYSTAFLLPPGGTSISLGAGFALSVNNATPPQVTGNLIDVGAADSQAFLYQNGQTALFGPGSATGYHVNDQGQVAGSLSMQLLLHPTTFGFGAFAAGGSQYVPLCFSVSPSFPLDINMAATGINNAQSPQIVGTVEPVSVQNRAYLEQNGVAYSLGALVSESDLYLLNAFAINDRSWIAGRAHYTGDDPNVAAGDRGFVAVPNTLGSVRTQLQLSPVQTTVSASQTADVAVYLYNSGPDAATHAHLLISVNGTAQPEVDLGTIQAAGPSTPVTTLHFRPSDYSITQGTMTISATVVVDQFDGNLANSTQTASVAVTPAAAFDLAVSMTQPSGATVIAGRQLSYTYTVRNVSQAASAGGRLAVALPHTTGSSTTYVQYVSSTKTPDTVTQAAIAYNLPAIAPNGSFSTTIVVTAPAAGAYQTTATLDNLTGDSNSTNNTTTGSVSVGSPPDLSVQIHTHGTALVNRAESYQIRVKNSGRTAANDAILTFHLPSAGNNGPWATFQSSSPAPASNDGHTLTFHVAALPAHGTFTATVKVTATVAGSFASAATIDEPGDPVSSNNTATVSVNVKPSGH